jgi:outer membrane protein
MDAAHRYFRPSGLLLVIGAFFMVAPAQAQQKIGYIDSDYILQRIPEYATIQQKVDQLAQDWQRELDTQRQQVNERFREYQARELLYTNEERRRRREEIVQAEQEVEKLRLRYFGPEGELFAQQEQLMRPLQEKILTAIEQVATEEGYDYVFDKQGDFLFLYTRAQLDLSNRVLEELGIEVDSQGRVSN